MNYGNSIWPFIHMNWNQARPMKNPTPTKTAAQPETRAAQQPQQETSSLRSHSPLPWRIETKEGDYTVGIDAANGKAVVWVSDQPDEGIQNEADAALIVRAVNNADKLAAALKRSMSWLSSYPGNGADAVYEQARAALAAYDASKGGAQ